MSDLWDDIKEYGRTEWKAILSEAYRNYEELPPWNKGKKGLVQVSEGTREKQRLAKLGKKRGPYKKRKPDSEATKARKKSSAKKSWINNDDRRDALRERNRMRRK